MRNLTGVSDRPLRTALAGDAAFEFIAGALLLIFAPVLGDWLLIGTIPSMVLGAVFIAAGLVILALARAQELSEPRVRALALANIAGGVIGWIVFAVAWSNLDLSGRLTLGLASDLLIAIGLWEWVELRRSGAVTEVSLR